MFNAPELITNIPDIAQIYAINDIQATELEKSIERMDGNILLDTMDEYMISRWENMLEITSLDDDSLEDRRFRVKTNILEKLPYTYRVLIKKLDTLCPDGYVFTLSENRDELMVKLSLKSKRMIEDVDSLLDETLPLNVVYVVSIIWNQYVAIQDKKYSEIKAYTYKQLREEILDYYD